MSASPKEKDPDKQQCSSFNHEQIMNKIPKARREAIRMSERNFLADS